MEDCPWPPAGGAPYWVNVHAKILYAARELYINMTVIATKMRNDQDFAAAARLSYKLSGIVTGGARPRTKKIRIGHARRDLSHSGRGADAFPGDFRRRAWRLPIEGFGYRPAHPRAALDIPTRWASRAEGRLRVDMAPVFLLGIFQN